MTREAVEAALEAGVELARELLEPREAGLPPRLCPRRRVDGERARELSAFSDGGRRVSSTGRIIAPGSMLI